MPILLYRVDERLIHGQVVVGWGSQLRPERYLVVDEEVAASEWEQDLYLLAVPEGAEALFSSPQEAREKMPGWRESPVKSVLLTRDIETMLSLAKGGELAGEEINLGGLHAKEGKAEVLPYLFLGEEDKALLMELAKEDLTVSARDLPGSSAMDLASLLA
jgi:PTS system mannose-specific IIB component/fructoselysine and glucoselysine-specific PTS system IIB component